MNHYPAFRTNSFIFCICFIAICLLNACQSAAENQDMEEWIYLFDGSDMKDWTPKFTGSALGVNYKNRFTVKDSLLSIRYSARDTFSSNFGHLFYKQKFSHYRLKATYRFVGEQMKGGPGWAFRNNGLMLHSQDPGTMGLHQDFPISLEVQLLGGDGSNNRTNANLCTPGTNVILNDSLFTPHCVNSTSKTYHGDQWVEIEALVLGDSLVQHILDGEVVFEFRNPTIGGGEISGYKKREYKVGEPIKEGFIAIQSESHPTDFKSIELLNLCGCMDKKAKNYKSYYVKADNASCKY